MYRYIFLVLFLLIIVSIHYLANKRVVARLDVSKGVKTLLGMLVYLNLLALFGYLFSRYYANIPDFLHYIFSLSIGITLLLLLATFFYELLFLAQRYIAFLRGKKRYFDIVFLVFIGFYLYLAIFSGSTTPKIVDVKVDENLFKTPIKIAQISDIHIGSLIGKKFIKDIVQKINAQNVDLVVITGDLVDTKPQKSKPALEELKELKSKYGTFYVVGNHEYFRGVDEIVKFVKTLGIKVLENNSEKVGDFYIVGVYDSSRREPKMNLKKAFRDIPKGAPTLLLMHQPRGIFKLGSIHPSLILSGHTHGGQIWPFGYVVKLFQPYIKGLHKLADKSYIYVNSGVGFWGPPMRVGTQSEIAIIKWR